MQANLLVACLFASFFVFADSRCPKRTDYNSRCRKPCNTDADCNRQKVCICDGVCGMSCSKKGTTCKDDYFKKPARGRIIINGRKHGDTILYKCNRGYTLYGPSMLTCSAIRKWKPWDQGTPTCKRICPDLGNPKDGRRMGDKFEVGNRIRFRCNPGYKLQGATVAVCLPGLTWSSAVPVCKTKSCLDPTLPSNSEIWRGKKSHYLYGDRILLRCNSGYSRAGSYALTCSLDGWSTSNFRCLPKSCGDPGTPANGRRIGELFTFRQIVRYQCNKGYELHGVTSRQCLENQRWRSRLPQCKLMDCGTAPALINGRYTGSSTYYGAVQTATCDTGYVLVGSNTAKCDNGGWTFDGEKPICQEKPRNCFNLDGVENGELVKHVVDHGKSVKYRCHRGYHKDETPWQKCDNGQITGTKPKCIKDKPKDCSNIPSIKNGQPNRYTVKHGNTVRYYCDSGYTLTGDEPRCDNGEIKGMVPYCKKDKPKDCFRIPLISNGRTDKQYVKHGETVDYYCVYGYQLIGNQPKCKNGVITGQTPYCRRAKSRDCTNIDGIRNGKLVESKVNHGDKVKYQCNSGYSMESKSVQRCNDGIVIGDSPTCKKIQGYQGCFYEKGYYSWWTYGDSIDDCRETCRKNRYKFVGFRNGQNICYCSRNFIKKQSEWRCNYACSFDKTLTCGGNWMYSVFRTDVTCPELQEPHNSKISTRKVEIGTEVTFSCDKDYRLEGTSVLKCENDGQWSHETPKCIIKERKCPKMGMPANGHISTHDVEIGTKVRFTCKSGFYIKGSDTVTCMSEGKWSSNVIPNCIQRGSLEDRYIGCYIDADDRALELYEGMYDTGSSFTERCIKSCGKLKVAKYAGLQFSSQCFCGRDYNKHGKATEESCDMVCQGHWTRKCGGVWRNSVYRTGCPKPADPDNGQSVDKWYDPNERASYKCKNGFDIEGRGQLCNGYEWIESIPKCVDKIATSKPTQGARCTLTFNDANLEVLSNSQEDGAQAVFRCKGVFILDGDSLSTCNNGKWDGIRRCLSPCKDRTEAGFTYTSENRIHGSTAEKNCSSGNRNIIYKCNDGVWVKQRDIACVSVINKGCAAPESIPNGRFRIDENKATYTCNNGYRMRGNSKITCSNGIWSGPLPQCSLPSSSCKTDTQSPLQALKDNVPNLRPQTFTCMGNHDLQGSAVSLCNKGNLRQPAPTCRKTTCKSCNANPESFDSMCSKHDIVFFGKVLAVEKSRKSVRIATKYVLKTPKSPSQEVTRNLKLPRGKWTLKVDVDDDCICPRLKKGSLYIIYLKQKDLPQNKMVYFAIPVVIERTRRAQLGHFCRIA